MFGLSGAAGDASAYMPQNDEAMCAAIQLLPTSCYIRFWDAVVHKMHDHATALRTILIMYKHVDHADVTDKHKADAIMYRLQNYLSEPHMSRRHTVALENRACEAAFKLGTASERLLEIVGASKRHVVVKHTIVRECARHVLGFFCDPTVQFATRMLMCNIRNSLYACETAADVVDMHVPHAVRLLIQSRVPPFRVLEEAMDKARPWARVAFLTECVKMFCETDRNTLSVSQRLVLRSMLAEKVAEMMEGE